MNLRIFKVVSCSRAAGSTERQCRRGVPQVGSTCSATASRSPALPGTTAGMGWGQSKALARPWRENLALWEVWKEGRLGRVLALLHALASSGQEEGMAPHFNLRSKREALLLPPGLQRQRDSCQAQLARSASEQAQQAQQLSASSGQVPLNCVHPWVLRKGPGPLALTTHQVREQETTGLEKLLGRRQRLQVWLFTLSAKEKSRDGES